MTDLELQLEIEAALAQSKATREEALDYLKNNGLTIDFKAIEIDKPKTDIQ